MNLNFKMSELIYSEKAIENNINNMPDINSLDNMLDLIVFCLQPVRNLLNVPMIITSGFRCKKVNELVGGVDTSQHLTGQAVDFIPNEMSIENAIFKIQTSNIEYDQLINEYDRWVHISYNKGKNRRQNLKY